MISPNQTNLDTFLEVAYHPIYSGHVKHLIYDASWFEEGMGLELYESVLLEQHLPLLKGTDTMNSEVLAEGLAVYRECVKQQRMLSINGELIAALQIGLRKFSSLRTFIIEEGWPFDRSLRSKADGPGQLYRNWNPLHLWPSDVDGDDRPPWIGEHFMSVLTALTASGRQVQHLDWHHRQTVELDQFSRLPEQFQADSTVTFQRLRYLSLWIGGTQPLSDKSIAAFSQFLHAADAIEEMRLYCGNPELYLPFLLLVRSQNWPHLRILCIDGFQISQTHLLTILHHHAGTLRGVTLHMVKLGEGL